MSSNAQVSNKRPYNESNAVNDPPKGGPADAEEDGELQSDMQCLQ